MRLGAVVGLSLLLSAVAACTPPGPPFLAVTGDATGSSIALQGNIAGSSIAFPGSIAGGSGSRYSLHVVDFDRTRFGSVADCFTAASARGLPFEICHGAP